MELAQCQQAAEILWNTWSADSHFDALPESCRPRTRADGYAIQRCVASHSGQATVGWKIAATSAAGQKHLSVDGPLAGRLLTQRVIPCGQAVPFGNNGMKVAEAEFAFRMARDLPPRAEPYQTEEVLAAVATLHPGIEIPDSRYLEFQKVGAPQLIADNACAHYYVLGPATTADWRSIDLRQHPVQAFVDGALLQTGSGVNVLGDPRIALAWIANELREVGEGLREGDIVTTGTAVVPVPIRSGCRVRGDFGVLGELTVELD